MTLLNEGLVKGSLVWKNVAATEEYIARVGSGESVATDIRRLSPEERLGDALFTGLRLTDGVNLDQRPEWEPRNLDTCSRWKCCGEVSGINLVDRSEVVHVRQVYRRPDDPL